MNGDRLTTGVADPVVQFWANSTGLYLLIFSALGKLIHHV